uniref:Uncharacterized protein n=1 Tax=Solanum lycopersicum TaxID=4081 RepID=A0A3Q7HYT8_SOLLC
KFNDLNKRYKRVNDILGKGTSCRVVENQKLLETMDHLSPKMKEEVKKLLNSKHLYFREMCAYHNSCGHNGGSGSGVVSGARGGHEHDHQSHEEEDDDMDERSRKRQRKLGTSSPMVQQLSTELANVVQDRGRSSLEKMQWMKTKMMQLEEQHVSYLCQAFELQKQRLKWKKFISKKEREMERDKLINERKKLENERMVLLLKQKELELLDYHQHHPNNNHRNSDPSSVTG